jgi:hypothetical protein
VRNYLVLGDWNAVCDRCGFRHKASALRKEWTGLMVCDRCWEPKHPQLMIRVPEEHSSVPWSRPEPTDVFINHYGEILYTEAGGFLTAEDGSLLFTED